MSRERARRRAHREALRAAEQAVRMRRARRRARWQALARRLRPAVLRRRPGRWAWGLGRRSRAQRLTIACAGVLLLFGVWYFFDSLSTRLGLSALVLLALPVLATISFDRKGMRL
jgi:hypothetical protein